MAERIKARRGANAARNQKRMRLDHGADFRPEVNGNILSPEDAEAARERGAAISKRETEAQK